LTQFYPGGGTPKQVQGGGEEDLKIAA